MMAGALEKSLDGVHSHGGMNEEPMENGGNLFAPDNDIDMDVPNITMKVCRLLHLSC